MPRHEIQSPASVYFVADHLDATLAAGEDLLEVTGASNAPFVTHAAKAVEMQFSLQRRFVERVRTLELVMVMRVLQARRRAEDLRRADARVAPMAGLFIGGTAALADAAEELGDATHVDFQTGDDTISYLRSRGVIGADAASLVNLDHLIVTSRFLIAERIELGVLLDLSATFLDTLELFFELYVEKPPIETELTAIGVTGGRTITL
jgi:hypothetical protein